MPGTGIANEDFFDLHVVTAVCWTRIDGMAVVNTTADRVTLNDFDTHVDTVGSG